MGGELDPGAAPYLRERLVEAVKDGPGSVRIDLSEVTFPTRWPLVLARVHK